MCFSPDGQHGWLILFLIGLPFWVRVYISAVTFNLLEEGFDAGIRIGELPDSSMRAVRVGFVRTVVCASPGYLKINVTPEEPEQLRDHPIISVAGSISTKQWRFEHKGNAHTVKLKPRLSVTNNDAAITTEVEGYGFTRALSYQTEKFIADGQLEVVLDRFEPHAIPVNIVHREGREVSAKLRAFIDVLTERMSKNSALNP